MAIIRQDEILEKAISGDPSAVPRYNLRAPDGTLIGENVALELANVVTQMGTPVNAAALNEMLAASGVTAGAASAYTLVQEGFALFDGAPVKFRLHTASGANATLNINGTGAKALKTVLGDAMPSAIPAGTWVTASYSAATDTYVLDGVVVSAAQIASWTAKPTVAEVGAKIAAEGMQLESGTYTQGGSTITAHILTFNIKPYIFIIYGGEAGGWIATTRGGSAVHNIYAGDKWGTINFTWGTNTVQYRGSSGNAAFGASNKTYYYCAIGEPL